MPDCSDIRKQWDDAFDSEDAPSQIVSQHLAGCRACRAYAGSTAGVRDALRNLPLGPINDEADRALLQALRSERRPAPTRRALAPMVFAGAGSFALTMIVAGVMLLAASGTPSGLGAPPSTGVARTAPPDADDELEMWIDTPGLITGVVTIRLPAPPEPPKKTPLRGQTVPPNQVA